MTSVTTVQLWQTAVCGTTVCGRLLVVLLFVADYCLRSYCLLYYRAPPNIRLVLEHLKMGHCEVCRAALVGAGPV